MDRIYRTVNIKDQETQHYYSHLIQHDARQRCPALIVLKEEHNNNRLHLNHSCLGNESKSGRRFNVLLTHNASERSPSYQINVNHDNALHDSA